MTWYSFRNRRREETNLLRYWDDTVRRRPATPVPPPDVDEDLASLVRALHSATVPAPERPAYADDLLRQLLATYKETSTVNSTASTAPPVIPDFRPRHDVKPHHPPRQRERPRRNLVPALEIALIIALILASLGAFWVSTGDNRLAITPGNATPTAESTPVHPADVPMYRGNPERTGVMPGPGPEGDPVELWQLELGGPIYSAPAVVDGVLYVGVGDGNLHAFNAATGEEIWSFAAASSIASSPAVVDGIVYTGSDDGTVYALNAADGTEVWTFPGGAQYVSVVVADGAVYTGSGDGFVHALDAATGEERWQAPLGDASSRSPTVADGVVYIGSANGILHTFDATTGEPGWTFQTEGGGLVATTAIANGLVYQTTLEGVENSYAYALDPATGEVVWRFAQDFNTGFLPPTVGANLVYLPSADGLLYAADAMTGEEIWSFATDRPVSASPALVGDTLYVAPRDGFVYALDAATGNEIWRFAVEGETVFGPTVSGGVAYVGTTFGHFYAIGGAGTATLAALIDATPSSATPEPVVTTAATPQASVELAAFLWETTGGPEPLDRPSDLTIAPDGTIWVPDGGNSRFQIFTPDGEFVESWGTLGSGDGEFNFIRPNSQDDAFAPDGTFYVADMGNQRIQHFSADRQFLNAWGSFGPDDGEFLSPIDVAVDSQGNVFVDDDKRNDIQKFDADGNFLLKFGGLGSEPGKFDFQGWLTIPADDTVWVAEARNKRVQQFTNDGQFLALFDGGGTLGAPEGVAVDDWGHIFVADWDGLRVVVLAPDGVVIGEWRPPDGVQIQEMTNIALDGEGNIYVVSYPDGTLLKFQLNPPLVESPEPELVASPEATSELVTPEAATPAP